MITYTDINHSRFGNFDILMLDRDRGMIYVAVFEGLHWRIILKDKSYHSLVPAD